MRIGLALLCFAYVLSQFYRTFLAVLTGPLAEDIGAGPEDLALASGLWFLVFAAMQVPVGSALDRVGPRRTASVLLLVGGGGGALVFAVAQAPWHVSLAMALLGVGCAPVLMAAYYIFARVYPPALFASLAAAVLGIGTLGNLFAAMPVTAAAETIGWRATMWVLAAVSALTALGIGVLVKDPPPAQQGTGGSFLDLFRIPALWLVFPIAIANYAPAAGVRGLWIGPYLRETYGADPATVGWAATAMGLAMIAGSFAYGPADRWFGTRKWVIFTGNAGALLALVALILLPPMGVWTTTALFALLGFCAASYPLVMAHGRAFVPDHLAGRGVALLNLLAIGTVGLTQVASGRLYSPGITPPEAAFQPVLLLYAGLLALALAIYLLARDRTD